jgi:hypothetical protein
MRTGVTIIAAALIVAASPVASQTGTPVTEMARIFEADQAARDNIRPEQYKDRDFITRMIAQDKARRIRTAELMRQGKLISADDLYYAAFIFQHGDEPNDYLLAHSLAVAATALGKKDGAWIAAATLDRYLQAIGQKQIYGTQYRNSPATGPTMEPYDRTLVPDALRRTLDVPAQVEQQKQLEGMKAPLPAHE